MKKSPSKPGILARSLARTLTPAELKKVQGGLHVCQDCSSKKYITTKDRGRIYVCDAYLCTRSNY